MRTLLYDSYRGDSLQLALPHDLGMKEILEIFGRLHYPDTGQADEQLSFALIELVSNSLRAQKERSALEPIMVRLHVSENSLEVEVLDHGGGFDFSALPFDLDGPVDEIDPMSESLGVYRLSHGYTRCGLGLLSVRKIFQSFKIDLIDHLGHELKWPSPDIAGTRIRLSSAILDGTEAAYNINRRKKVRDHCFARVYLRDQNFWGHVADINDEGLRVRLIGIVPEGTTGDVKLLISIPDIGIDAFEIDARLMWRMIEGASTVLGLLRLAFANEAAKAGFDALRRYYQAKSGDDRLTFIDPDPSSLP
jgi:anti-sigma regulatory factor (Ser/Thr protein kinase)